MFRLFINSKAIEEVLGIAERVRGNRSEDVELPTSEGILSCFSIPNTVDPWNLDKVVMCFSYAATWQNINTVNCRMAFNGQFSDEFFFVKFQRIRITGTG
jgi:hypothetical protein